jgi:pyruvate carboxylase
LAPETISTHYLFVYGTLRKGVDIPINKKIADDVEWIGVGQLKGSLYDIGSYPGAVNDSSASVIKGDVFKLLHPEKTLTILDKYERFYPDNLNLTKSDYIRKDETIELDNGEKVKAGIYWYNQSVKGKVLIEKGDYLIYLKEKKTAK